MKKLFILIFTISHLVINGQKVEAENYDNASGVIVRSTLDSGGGKYVYGIRNSSSLKYLMKLGSGKYLFKSRIASAYPGIKIHILSADTLLSCDIPNTGGRQAFITAEKIIRVENSIDSFLIVTTSKGTASWSFNWFELIPLNNDPYIFTQDSIIHFPDNLLLSAFNINPGDSIHWRTLSKTYHHFTWNDSSLVQVQPYASNDTAHFEMAVFSKDGSVKKDTVTIRILYDPWRVLKRIHLGELGDLVIFSNGEHLFSGPCQWDCNLGSVQPGKLKSND